MGMDIMQTASEKKDISFFDRITMPLCRIKAEKVEKHARKYINGKVLDIGAGRCLIAHQVEKENKRRNVKVIPIDVIDVNVTNMKLYLYEGKKLPFKNKSFDAVMINYVLHHCDNPIKVLKEAIRVCKGNIILFEDTNMNFIAKSVDSAVNKLNNDDINTPMNFKTEKQWRELFKNLKLEIVAVEKNVEKEWFYPFIEHTMFVVKER